MVTTGILFEAGDGSRVICRAAYNDRGGEGFFFSFYVIFFSMLAHQLFVVSDKW